MDWIETHEKRRYDAIMLLEPSSPFARPEHFDEAVELFVARKASLVVGMRETEVASIFVGTLGSDGSIGGIVEKMLKTPAQRRQDQPPEVTMNGALYLDRLGGDAQAPQDLRRSRRKLRHPDGPPAFDRDRERGRPRLRLLCHRARHARCLAVAETTMTRPRRIAVVTGSRADYGLLRGILARLKAADDVDLSVIACGMHLLPKFGETWRAIEADGFPIAAQNRFRSSTTTVPRRWRAAPASALTGFADALPKLAPDVLVVLGDRYEILAAAVAATLLNIPIAHIHGGEVTAGAFDDAIRHAITKMACLAFRRGRALPAARHPDGRKSGFRLQCRRARTRSREHSARPSAAPNCLRNSASAAPSVSCWSPCIRPPRSRTRTQANVAALLGALADIEDRSFIFTGVNADPGYRAIDDAIRRFVAARPGRAQLFTSLGSERYWAALRLADAVVGNSSSGILEAPAVGVPSINIGDRQKGRLRAASIIDCPANPAAILAACKAFSMGGFASDPAASRPMAAAAPRSKIAGTLRKIDLRAAFPKHFHDLGRRQIDAPKSNFR